MGIRIVFMGTGNLALPSFLALCRSTHEVIGLVTQPDRTGRGHHQHINPIKTEAVDRNLPVLQPDSIKTPTAIEELRSLDADLFVVAAYGQILSPDVLAIPRLGTINIHASLLPKYRGATPIHAAILHGDEMTGVTIIEIEPKMDAGPMLGRVATPIGLNETTGELEKRLADLAVPLTLQVIDQIVAGTVTREQQDSTKVIRVRKLSKQDGRIDWSKPNIEIERHIRAMQPWPSPFTELHQTGKPPLRLQVHTARIVSSTDEPSPRVQTEMNAPGNTGAVIATGKDSITVQCGIGMIELVKVQPDGKKPMSTSDFLRGRHLGPDDSFS
ncbi:MAG: methionyl-tRNA formyltransferase [Planctomycetes bacterium]|nr:methionyl-tRNA formyltransferase [Planctomycetota bacterium]